MTELNGAATDALGPAPAPVRAMPAGVGGMGASVCVSVCRLPAPKLAVFAGGDGTLLLLDRARASPGCWAACFAPHAQPENPNSPKNLVHTG